MARSWVSLIAAAAAVAAGAVAPQRPVHPTAHLYAGRSPVRSDARVQPPTDGDPSEWYVNTALGPVQGVVFDNARTFMSLPYAMPPVGDLRWQPPQPAVSWGDSVWQGIYDPPGCVQLCGADEQPPHVCPYSTGENCLYLNVWTPRLATMTAPAPVTVFIHGGAFKTGYAGGIYDGIVYDASSWVNSTGQVVVAINYRLGAQGFLAAQGSTSINGNYGLQDQEMALQWVRQYIGAFGGDGTRVTVIGQSAGAMSIASHLSRPEASGLFAGAVMHSEPFSLPFRDPPSSLDLANAFAKFANCSDGSGTDWPAIEVCLRGIDADTMLSAQMSATHDILDDWRRIVDIFVPWVPTYGTPYLPVSPLAAFQAGNVLDVPIMLGTVANESNLFINFAFNTSVDEVEYDLALDVIIGLDAAPKVKAQYPVPSPPPTDYRGQLMVVATDMLFRCPVRNVTASVATTVGLPRRHGIWQYWYSHVESFNQAMWGTVYPFIDCWPVACHGEELVELFRPEYPQYGTNYTTDEVTLSLTMQSYWAAFAANGSPGMGQRGDQASWPAYNLTTRQVMILQAGSVDVAADLFGEACDFWDTQVGYDFY